MSDSNFILMHRNGEQKSTRDRSLISSLLNELDGKDLEHPDVSVTTKDGWTLTIMPGWKVIIENVEDIEVKAQHIFLESREAVIEKINLLIDNNMHQLQSAAWFAGY